MTKENAIVITDAEDSCAHYSRYAFFIAVQGASFQSFSENLRHQYVGNDQMIVFDGKKIYPVNHNGYVIR
jgi:hypothetical protein